MSTDDLTRRAREAAARSHHTRPALADLLSELADEVDRLRRARAGWQENALALGRQLHAAQNGRDEARAEADRFRTLWDRHGKNDLLAERDAARAALERVRVIIAEYENLDELVLRKGVVYQLNRALEGS